MSAHTHHDHEAHHHEAGAHHEAHPTEHFLERNWYWFTVAFAILFVLAIDNFAPVI